MKIVHRFFLNQRINCRKLNSCKRKIELVPIIKNYNIEILGTNHNAIILQSIQYNWLMLR